MSGGASPQTSASTSNQSQNTSSTTGVNPYITPQLQQGVQDLTGYYNNNPTAPAYYPGGTYAAPAAGGDTQAAIQALTNRGTQGSAFMPAASSTIENILNPNYLNANNDPNFQASLMAGFNPQNLNFNNTTLPNIRSQFEGSGRNLGGADMAQSQLALQNLDQTQSNAAATAAQTQYGQNQNMQMAALGLLPSFQNMDYQNIGALTAAGQTQDQIAQNQLNSNVAGYNYNSTAQPNYISNFLSQIQAAYPGGQTTGTGTSNGYSTGTATPASNSTSSFLGGGLGLAGLGLQAAAIPATGGGSLLGSLFSSDREDKTDVKELGIDPLTGLKMYAYRYKGDPKTYPKVVGPMAQDIEASGGPVREIGGHKVVVAGGLF